METQAEQSAKRWNALAESSDPAADLSTTQLTASQCAGDDKMGVGAESLALKVLWADAERAFCRLGRGDAEGHRYAFIPVLPDGEHPTIESINRLTHEYELREYLDGAWAVLPVEFVREPGRTMLVVEYTGGEPLDRLIGQPMEIGRFLRLAVGLSATLGRLHGGGLIH